MRFVMKPDMVYQYPIWAVGLLIVGASVFGAVLIELCARRLLPIELRQRHLRHAPAACARDCQSGGRSVAIDRFSRFLSAWAAGHLTVSAEVAGTNASASFPDKAAAAYGLDFEMPQATQAAVLFPFPN